MTLSGKRVLVVIGSSDIEFGRLTAAHDAGAAVVVASRSVDKVEPAVARLGFEEAIGGRCHADRR